jgi:uncharacterized membrane protein
MSRRNRGLSRVERERRLHQAEGQGRQVVGVQQSSLFVGPVPHPAILREYNEVIPGAGDLILQSFKQEGDHRRSMEERMVACEEADRKATREYAGRGQLFAFLITLLGLSVALALGLAVPPPAGPTAASIVGGGTLAAIVTTFLVGKTGKDSEKDKGSADKKQS